MKSFLFAFFISVFFSVVTQGAENDHSTSSSDSSFKRFVSIKAEKQILSTYDSRFVGSSSFSIAYRASEYWDFYIDHIVATNYIFGTDGRLSLNSYGVGSRYFCSPSFYFKGGLSRQNIVRSRDDWQVGMTIYVADISIGNEWRSNHFIFGVDWIGFYSQALHSQTNINTPSVLYPNENAEAQDVRGRLRGPNFYVGFSF